MPTATSAFPGDPDLVRSIQQFANTQVNWVGHTERFADVPGLREWLSETGQGDVAADVTAADVITVREIRDALVTVLLGHSRDPLTDEQDLAAAHDHLERVAQRYPLVTVINSSGAHLRPAQQGLASAIGRILAAVTELAMTNEWPRLKACRNASCHIVFFDKSRNTSGAYCTTQCSTQVAMRAYRSRKQARA